MFITRRLLFSVLLTLLITGCEQIVLDATDPLEKSGPYQLSKNDLSIDTATSGNNINATLYFPKGTFASNSLPLVILLPGFSLHYWDYEIYAFHLASHGYIVLGMDYVETSSDNTIAKHDDKAAQVKEVIDYALTSSTQSGSINNTKIAVIGHSLGGKIAFYAAAQDSRIKAIVAMDPVNAGGPPCQISPENCANYPVAPNPGRGQIGIVKDIQAASLIFKSNPDPLTNPEFEFNAYFFYSGSDGSGLNGVPSPAFYIDMGNTPHAYYMPKIISPAPAVVKRDSLAWLETVFKGIDYSIYFTGIKMQADIAANRVKNYSSRGSY